MESSSSPRPPSGHDCPGPACDVTDLPSEILACKRHWFQVTNATRARVWRTWTSGDGDYLDARAQAISEMRP